jgi:hypothetical protein
VNAREYAEYSSLAPLMLTQMCSEAISDPDRRRVYGGSMSQCIRNCLPERCGGEPKWKGWKGKPKKWK